MALDIIKKIIPSPVKDWLAAIDPLNELFDGDKESGPGWKFDLDVAEKKIKIFINFLEKDIIDSKKDSYDNSHEATQRVLLQKKASFICLIRDLKSSFIYLATKQAANNHTGFRKNYLNKIIILRNNLIEIAKNNNFFETDEFFPSVIWKIGLTENTDKRASQNNTYKVFKKFTLQVDKILTEDALMNFDKKNTHAVSASVDVAARIAKSIQTITATEPS
jgi:hypothetical protein